MGTKHEVSESHLKERLAIRGDGIKRGILTTQLAKTTQLHPKSIGRSMRTLQMRSARKVVHKRGRSRYYDRAVDATIYELWVCMEYPCAETMHPIIESYIISYQHNQKWTYSDETTGKLRAISLGTLKNRISSISTIKYRS